MAASRREEDDGDDEAPRPKKKGRSADTAADDERKKPKKQPPKSNLLLFGLIGGGAMVLLFGCLLVGVLGYVFWPKKDGAGGGAAGGDKGGGDKAKSQAAVTLESFKKIKTGQSRKEVEDLLGPGDKTDVQEVTKLLNKQPRFRDEPPRSVDPAIANRPEVSYAVWRKNDDHLVAAYITSKKYGEVLAFAQLHLKTGPGEFTTDVRSDTPAEIDRRRDKLEADMKFYNDPRWKKGQAKSLIVGAWGNPKFYLEFKADGTMSLPGPLAFGAPERSPGKYKFLDDEHIQYDIPESKFGKADRSEYKVLANENELCLILRAEQPFIGGAGPEQRYFNVRPGDVLRRFAGK